MIQIKTSFLIGLNDKNTLKQEIKTQEAIKAIKQVLFKHGFNYMSITRQAGVYVMEESKAQVQEKSIKVEVIESIKSTLKHKKARRAVVEDLKQVLNQESIGLIFQFINARF